MLKTSAKRPIVFVLTAMMLLAFCAPPRASAGVIFLVPAVAVGVVTAVGGLIGVVKKSRDSGNEKKEEHAKRIRNEKAGGEPHPSHAGVRGQEQER